MKYFSKQLVSYALLAFIFVSSNAKKPCQQKIVENSGIVCVCNLSYCDDFPPLQTQQFAFADVYESSKNGSRLEKTVLKFEKSFRNSSASHKQIVTINTNDTYQTILGFGGAFTDTFGQLLNQLPLAMAYNIIADYFSPNGIEYSMARTPIGGSDFSPRPYSYDDVDGDLNLTHWKLQTEDFEFKIPYIRLAQKLSARELKLFASPWSPPAWMKTNNKFNESGKLKGTVGGEYYQTWANYFVKYLDAYKSNGINLWGITVENEPTEGQKMTQINALYLDSSMERDFLKLNLGPTLNKAGYGADKLKIMIYDDNTPQLQEWSDTILSDSDAAKWVSGIAFHWYSNSRSGEFPAALLDSVHANHSQYFLLNTEACNLTQAGNGRWDFGEDYARDIIRDLNHHTSGWIDWNMALDMNGGPHWNSNHSMSSPVLIDVSAKQYYKQPMFYAMAHFSKFLCPDSVRVGVQLDTTDDKLWVTAFERPDKAIAVIAANLNDVDIELSIFEHKFGVLTNTLPAHSMQSYIWWQ